MTGPDPNTVDAMIKALMQFPLVSVEEEE